MKRFIYRAKDKEGRVISGVVEASTDFQAAKLVREKGLVVISLRPATGTIKSLLEKFQNRVPSKQLTSFTRQLATMISAGLPITEALSILRSQTSSYMQKIVSQVLVDVDGGEAFSAALSKYPKVFSPTYVALIRSGETGGVLDQVLLRLSENLEKQDEFKGKVKSAMVYPIIIVMAMVGVAFIMMIFVIPGLVSIYEGLSVELPITTRILIGVSKFSQKFWPLVMVGVGLAFYGFMGYKATAAGKRQYDRFILKIPLLGELFKTIILSEMTSTLSLMVGSGVSILEALNIAADVVDNVIISEALRDAAKTVERGFPITYAFSRHPEVFPFILAQMIAVGEETGKMAEVLGKISHIFEIESDNKLKAVTAAIEPMVLIVLGIGVAFLIVSILLPIYTLTTSL